MTKQSSDPRLTAVKIAIKNGDYEDARRRLAKIDGTTARAWEQKLDEMDPPEPPPSKGFRFYIVTGLAVVLWMAAPVVVVAGFEKLSPLLSIAAGIGLVILGIAVRKYGT